MWLHLGKTEPEYIETLKMAEGEDIDYIAWSYSEKGVHTLTFKTNHGNILLAEADVEEQHEGSEVFDLNLRDHNKAIVGFRTGFNENLEFLAVHVATRLSDKERQATSAEAPTIRITNPNVKHKR